ncbi:MAG: LytTR family DNA-binding domain-containing protein [bacterium]
MKKIRSIIIDDESLAREDLKNLLNEFEEVEIVGEASNISEAIDAISNAGPDLIFLDIQLKDESGFELLDKIDPDIKVIFVTAYDKYAIRAFEVNAQDYLLKPVIPDRLRLALSRINSKDENSTLELSRLNYDDSIFLLLNNKYSFVKISSVMVISSAGDYTEIITGNGEKKLTSKPMREWEDRLPERHFCRIHRSTIINLAHIERIEDWFNQSHCVYIKGIESPFMMSRGYAAKIKKALG